MAREAIPTWYFVLVVVRRGNQYLLVHERKFGQTWYLPAGRVERGEDFSETAHRETLEETGVPIVLEGILRLEYTPEPNGEARARVIFAARPADNTPPKSIPDEESLGAAWFTLEEIETLPLRGEDALQIFRHVDQGGPIYPLNLLTVEGAPFVSVE